MSYASRELTHGFHFLSLAQLILQPLVLGYVVEHALHQRNGSVRSLKQFGFVTEPQDTAIASAHSILGLIEFAGFLHALLGGESNLTVVFVNAAHPDARIRKPLVSGEAQHGFDLRAYEVPPAKGPHFCDVGDGG